MDKNDNIAEGPDTSCILLIEKNGIITKAGCPFQVICTQSLEELTEGGVYTVQRVSSTKEDNILFDIDGNKYPHTIFLLFHGLFSHEDYKYPNSDIPF